CMKATNLLWNGIACDFMNQSAKAGILLRRSSHHGKRPDRILPVIHFMYFHQREWVQQGIITDMITKWTDMFIINWIYRTCNNKNCISRETVTTLNIEIAEATVAKSAGKDHFRKAFWKGHHRRTRM